MFKLSRDFYPVTAIASEAKQEAVQESQRKAHDNGHWIATRAKLARDDNGGVVS